MAKRILPTPEQLRQLLRYEPDTGKLFWKERPLEMFLSEWSGKMWNARYAGEEAFTARGRDGYRRGAVLYTSMLAHRVAWAIYHGDWPENHLDHVNGDKTDNRIENLRSATNAENMRNTGLRADNKSGFKGVSWNAGCGKWQAHIRVDGKTKHLGLFDAAEAAHQAYCKAAAELHGQFARTA